MFLLISGIAKLLSGIVTVCIFIFMGIKEQSNRRQENPEIFYFYKDTGERCMMDRGNPDIAIANNECYTRFKAGHPAGYIEAFANYYCDLRKRFVCFFVRKKKTGKDHMYLVWMNR